MSKLYNSQKAGIAIISGKIKEISEDRKNVEVSYRDWDAKERKANMKTKTLVVPNPVDASYVVGKTLTAAGYIMGPQNVSVISISNKQNLFETEQIAVLSGNIVKAALNPELNEDGSPKLKQNSNEPRKPHFDIQVEVEENGDTVHHFVKIYNSPKYQKEGEASNIEKYQKRFADFKNPEETPMRVTIITQPGQNYTFEKNDGSIYHGCSHLGANSVDIEYEFSKQQQKDVQTPAQEASTPTAPAQEAVAQETTSPTIENEVNGFDEDLEMEFE